MHDVAVSNVAIGKRYNLSFCGLDQFSQFIFRPDRYPLWIKRTRQRRWVGFIFDAGNLGCGESDHFVIVIVTEIDVEIMKISSCRSHDNDFFPRHFYAPHLNRLAVWLFMLIEVNIYDSPGNKKLKYETRRRCGLNILRIVWFIKNRVKIGG